jgi:hypothetical protein
MGHWCPAKPVREVAKKVNVGAGTVQRIRTAQAKRGPCKKGPKPEIQNVVTAEEKMKAVSFIDQPRISTESPAPVVESPKAKRSSYDRSYDEVIADLEEKAAAILQTVEMLKTMRDR